MIYSSNYRIGLDDIGVDNRATNRSFLKIMQDIAALHSEYIGYGLLDLETNQRGWMILDWKIKVIDRPLYNTELKVDTWSRKIDRLCAYRDFNIEDKDSNKVAIATSRWILVNTERRRPVKITKELEDLYQLELDKSVFDEEIEPIQYEGHIFKKEYSAQRRDIDINGHMNNLAYLDMAYEIIPENIYKTKVFNNIRITYKKEIIYGEKVECYYTVNDDRYIIEVKNKEKLKAVVELY